MMYPGAGSLSFTSMVTALAQQCPSFNINHQYMRSKTLNTRLQCRAEESNCQPKALIVHMHWKGKINTVLLFGRDKSVGCKGTILRLDMRSVSIVFLPSIFALWSTVSSTVLNISDTQALPSDDPKTKGHAMSDRPNGFPASGSLRMNETANGEERRVFSTITSQIKSMAKLPKPSLPKKSRNRASHPSPPQDPELVKTKALTEVEGIIEVKTLKEKASVFSRSRKSSIETLTKQYEPDVMTQVLFNAHKSGSGRTKKIALQLISEQLKLWEKQKKSVADVFKLLKLNGPERDLAISDGRLVILNQYAKDTSKGTESSDAVLIQTLLHGYDGDDKFALVLDSASKHSDDLTQGVAHELVEKYFSFLSSNEVSFDNLFLRLKLNDGPNGYQAIIDGRLTLLERFIKSKRGKDSSDAVLIQTLLKGYDGDDKFVRVLDPALKHSDHSTWEAAFELEKKYLLTLWNEKLSFDDLFQRLKMNDGPKAYVAISDGRLALLELFIKMHGHGEASDTFLIQTLVKGYGGDDKFAQKIKYFITLLDHEVSYDDLFSKLKLNDGLIKYEAVYDGRIKLLNEYIQFKSGESSSGSALIQTLVKGYGGGEKFALVLCAAQKDEKTIEEAAHALEIKYFETLSREVSVQDLFKRLKARRENASLFGSWKLKMLARYDAYLSNKKKTPM
ncbi:hypothetical protein PsorP6_002785 [Peronosclerospora sorghi]|uniref:Uncharacterized protein n=1 Tax=Peronosclerospora sorghi TaxID=230839 RepID=A0ACC0VLE6_9STRA|nr:hypothetical protein PsorP6_002785 [Peronosclerospora sorghi]